MSLIFKTRGWSLRHGARALAASALFRAGVFTATAAPPAGGVTFDHNSGFCAGPFEVRLSAKPGATIYYTTNALSPGPRGGLSYKAPIRVETTVVLRAAAFEPGASAPIQTGARTYLFEEAVLGQTGSLYAEQWGTEGDRPVQAYYRGAPAMLNDGAARSALSNALSAIPLLCIVTDPSNLFDAAEGLYTHPTEHGKQWERPTSIELAYPDGRSGFRVDCGLRIHGGLSRRPEESPKHSFRLLFKKKYGGRLSFPLFGEGGAKQFKTLVLRAGYNDAWVHPDGRARQRATYLRDEWMRESMLAMGYPSARGIFVHLCLDGLYWGVYNLCERPDADFVAATEGGAAHDYDSRKASEILSGDACAWDRMTALANAGLYDRGSFDEIRRYLDLTEFADYMILNYFAGNSDWDRDSNWYAARRRSNDGRFRFYVWDGECTLEEPDACTIDFDDENSPPGLFHKLCFNPEFRKLFDQRIRQLLLGKGPLSREVAAERFRRLANGLSPAIQAEAARWGGYRGKAQQDKTGPYESYTGAGRWRSEVERVLTEYFPGRAALVLKQFRERGLLPASDREL